MTGAAPRRSGFVTLSGRPNVGKSTLTNLLVGEKVAIVSEVPQTTRCRIQGIRTLPGGQIVIVDTPGIHRPHHTMNRWMVAEASEAMRGVDLIMFVIEAGGARREARGRRPADALGPGDMFVLSMLPREGTPVVLAINKVDRVRKASLLPVIAAVKDLFPFQDIFPISALTGENTEGLAERLLSYLPEGEPLFPEEDLTSQHERFLAAELVREKILHHTRQEIPHETCVLIDRYEESADGLRRIEATILVEKESQKAIVIGRDGALLKTIGIEARLELERLLGGRVFLRTWVKVREGWRDDEATLRALGLRRTG